MDKIKELLGNFLKDESKAKDEYGDMLDAIDESSMSDEIKILASTLIEKIQVDEKTHFEMLKMLNDVINNI